MLTRLVEQGNKPIIQVAATTDMKRGAPISGGAYFADIQKNYDGVNAVIEPKEADFEDIKSGSLYNRVPTYVGERYATTELTVGSMQVGAPVKESGGKFVSATSGTAEWLYQGVYSNPYGLTMYIVEKVPVYTVS